MLTLLLVRRRVFRLEDEERDAEGREVLTVYCPRRDATYTVPAVMPAQSSKSKKNWRHCCNDLGARTY